MSGRANAEGWLDMGAGLTRKTHFFKDGVAICNSRITWGTDRLQRGSDMPGPNSCMVCLTSWSRKFDAPEDAPSTQDDACHECDPDEFEWSDTLWVDGAPVMVCRTHGHRAPGHVYEAAL